MIIFKSVISTDNFYLEKNMSERINPRPLALQEKE